MAECQNLCTAEKCAQLEEDIKALQEIVGYLNNQVQVIDKSLQNHLGLAIPEAHEFTSNVSVDLNYSDKQIDIQVELENIGIDNDTITLDLVTQDEYQNHLDTAIPEAHDYQPDISVDISSQEDKNDIEVSVEVSVDEESDRDSFKIPVFNADDQDYVTQEELDKSVDDISNDIKSINDDVDDLNKDFNDFQNEFNENVQDYFNNLDFYFTINNLDNNDYEFNLTIGEKTRNPILDLKSLSFKEEEIIEELPFEALSIDGSYDDVNNDLIITVSVNGKSAETLINLDAMPFQEIKELVEKAVAILGGDTWSYDKDSKTAKYKFQPESLIKTTGQAQYRSNTDTGKELTISNLIELGTALHSVNYFRSGHHRLPAKTVTNLLNTKDGNKELKIYDSLSFQEWIITNLDALVGEFPIKLKYKETEGQEPQEIVFNNTAEAITELTGLLLSLAQESNNNLNATMKALVEARTAANAAIVAVDYASANAEYLGYKGKEKTREVNVTFTPGEKTMSKVLKPSKQKIVGWEITGAETLTELVKRVLIGAEIIKAAMYIPWKPGAKLTGDIIKEKREEKQQQDDQKWEQFINRVNNPTGQYQVKKPN